MNRDIRCFAPWTAAVIPLLVIGGLFVSGAFTSKPLPGPTSSGRPGQIAASPINNSPIKHVVIIVRENHSFDNLFGQMPRLMGRRRLTPARKVVPLIDTPDPMKQDLGHGGHSALGAVDGGKMDGFYKLVNASQDGMDVADSQYTQEQIPDYWTYAQKYSIADHFFSTILASSFPNHLAMIAGSANGTYDNPSDEPVVISLVGLRCGSFYQVAAV